MQYLLKFKTLIGYFIELNWPRIILNWIYYWIELAKNNFELNIFLNWILGFFSYWIFFLNWILTIFFWIENWIESFSTVFFWIKNWIESFSSEIQSLIESSNCTSHGYPTTRYWSFWFAPFHFSADLQRGTSGPTFIFFQHLRTRLFNRLTHENCRALLVAHFCTSPSLKCYLMSWTSLPSGYGRFVELLLHIKGVNTFIQVFFVILGFAVFCVTLIGHGHGHGHGLGHAHQHRGLKEM